MNGETVRRAVLHHQRGGRRHISRARAMLPSTECRSFTMATSDASPRSHVTLSVGMQSTQIFAPATGAAVTHSNPCGALILVMMVGCAASTNRYASLIFR